MTRTPARRPIWANLIHLSFNMWFDCPPSTFKKPSLGLYDPALRFDDGVWGAILERMAAVGMNMVVLDLGDAVRYRSHPEIAVRNAWTPKRLRQEIARAKALGIELIPKLNFATAHDAWLGPYARQVSTEPYYRVCRDLIAEVCELFDGPRLFHLGMDEETAVNQIYSRLAVIRQFDLYWHDLNLLFEAVRKGGARPWVWSDYQWYHPQQFLKHMPTSVLQSNWWYYRRTLRPETILTRSNPQVMDDGRGMMSAALKLKPVKAYLELDRHGYEQVPTGGFCAKPANFEQTVSFARKHLSPKRVLGFMQTTWYPTLPAFRDKHLQAIERVGAAIRRGLWL